MKIPFSPPDISEREIELVNEVLRSGWITTGPKTKQLEALLADFCGTEEVACLNSATAAMELTLRALGIGEGDEVITSAYTYTASASVIAHVGAKVVLVDTAPGSYFMDIEQLAAAISQRTKAIIPVDIAGVPADYYAIRAAIDLRASAFKPNSDLQKDLGRVAIIADAAHSLGAIYDRKPAAMAADFSCFSFHAVKNLTTAEGGAVAFDDIGDIPASEIYERFMLLSLHGQSKDALAKTRLGAWEYDILYPAYKCNMMDITAAIGIGQLERYPALLARRYELVKNYNRLFASSRVKPLAHSGEGWVSSHHLYLTQIEGSLLEERNAVIEALAAKGISANVHYKPLPMMTAYRRLGFDIADFPNSYNMYKSELTLPLHTLLTDEQQEYLAAELLAILG
ncbi:MAG: DegT/DnrJ/EryC1/StrS aminotransferase family protein [Oscillospiraceae bacterium]|nr:DegT/DnrJ/EryC1/StrS aminotransferase family protein [Oscillospiraceae bacterium]